MNSKSFAFLALLATLTTTLPVWADYTETSRTLAEDETVQVDGKLEVPSGVTVDLNGHSLTYTGIATFSGTGTITDRSAGEPGRLTINVAEGKTAKNGTDAIQIKLEGNLRLVKTGKGTLSVSDATFAMHTYSGGTDVKEGTLTTGKYGGTKSSGAFGEPALVTVREGATFDSHGVTTFTKEDVFTLDGGTYKSHYSQKTAKQAQSIALTGSSTFMHTKATIFAGSVAMDDGCVFTIEASGSDAGLTWRPSSVEGGTVCVNSGSFTLGADVGMPASGTPTANLDLGAKANIAGDFTYSVKDLAMATGASVVGTIDVYGTYKPDGTVNEHVRMQGGSTLDLSELSEAVPARFGSGTVTIALGSRTLTTDMPIVSWTIKPDATIKVTSAQTGFDASKVSITDSGIVYDAQSQEVVAATWTGKGRTGALDDPDNWDCRTAAGNPVAGVPAETLTVAFSGDVSDIAFNGQFPFAGVRFVNAELSKPCDWTGFDLNLLTDDSVLDMKGNALTVSAGTGESTTEATITSSAEGAELTFVVDEGEAYTNSTLNLSGELKLVKDGAGTFVAKKCPQEYAGVTEVHKGTLRCGIANVNTANGKSPFGAACTIDLLSGSALDPAGSYYWGNHTINMRGGAIANTVKTSGLATGTGNPVDFAPKGGNTNPGLQFNPKLVLFADATLSTTEDFNFQGKVTQCEEYKLILSIAAEHYILWNPSSATSVNVVVTGGGILGVWCKNPVAQANTALTVEDGTLALSKHDSYGSGNLSVCDYLSSTETMVNLGGADLFVSGTFTPASDYFYGCTMQNGSTIDLGSKTETWNVKSSSTGYNTVKFAADATVTLKLGDREVTPGDLIVAWEKRPVDVTFAFAGANVDSEIPVVWADEGLRYGYAEEPQIVWTNAKGNGDLTDSGNWEGGVVPTDIKATFTGDVSSINIPAGKAFTAEKIWFREATLSVDADFSWLDINKVANDSILDLCGHDLTLSCVDGGCTNAGTVTDTSAEGMGGTVTFVVPEGVTYTNSNFNFTGSLNFVKDGKGVLVAEKYPQVYTGTTVVNAGGVRCAEKANMNATDKQSPFGSQCTITLNEDTFLDPAGSANWGFHTVNMNGGIISNTVERMDVGAQYSSTTFNNPFNPTINLMVDSLFVSTKTFTFKGTIKGDGYTLTVKIPDVRWASSKSDAVTIEFVGTGRVRSLKHFQTNEPKVTLIMNGAKFDAGGAWAVSNYVAQSASAFADVRSAEDAKLYVTGTFTPVADDFFGCTMQNGSVIDLSQKTDTWSIVRPNVTTARAVDYVHFAENATVTIDFGDRSISSRKPILSWTEATHPADGVTFKLTDAALANHYVIDVRDDGVYAKRKGMLLLLK